MAYKCDPCDCSEQHYRNPQAWQKAMITLLCDIETAVGNIGGVSDNIKRDKIIFGIGDGSALLTTGIKKVISIPYNCTVENWTVLSDDPSTTAGDIVIDVWKDTYANYPPLVGDSMVGAGNKPTIVAAGTKGFAVATGWTTTSIAKDEILRFNIDSVNTLTSVTLILGVIKV